MGILVVWKLLNRLAQYLWLYCASSRLTEIYLYLLFCIQPIPHQRFFFWLEWILFIQIPNLKKYLLNSDENRERKEKEISIYLFIYLFIHLFILATTREPETDNQGTDHWTFRGEWCFFSLPDISIHTKHSYDYIFVGHEKSVLFLKNQRQMYLILFNLAIEHVFQTPPPPLSRVTNYFFFLKVYKNCSLKNYRVNTF